MLATTDGVTFHPVAQLAETVRYAAVAVSGHFLWVFGGEHQHRVTTDIQRVDLTTGRVTVAARLPTPLAHACAVVLNGSTLTCWVRQPSPA
jgi:hypothetical protein